MSYPFPKPLLLPFWGGERTILKRDAMLIRVRTSTGLTGYAPGPAHERAALEIKNDIAPFLLGKDPRQWKQFQFPAQDAHLVKTYRATEIALADLASKSKEIPLSEELTGRRRDQIKLYGSAGMYMTPESYAEEAAAIAALGFPAYKMRPALGPDKDLETLERMRRAASPSFGLMLDAHAWWRMGDRSYSFDTVAQLAQSMHPYRPTWIEEPLPPEDHAAYRKLRQTSPVPLASGEHEPDEAGFEDLTASRAVDYIQMDLCCQGGFAACERVMASAQRHGIRFAFHSWGTALEVLAAAHVGICWSEQVVEWLEYPCYSDQDRPGMYPFPLAHEILQEPLCIHEGYLSVPTGPGLGIAINEDVIEKYPFRSGPWSLFKIDSPAETFAVVGDHSVKWI